MHKRQPTWAVSNIFVVYMFLVNFRNYFELMINPVRKTRESGLCLEIYPVYLEYFETRIKFAIKTTTSQISLER